LDLLLRPIDYEDGGGSGWTFIKVKIVSSFLDADFRFEEIRIDTEHRTEAEPTALTYSCKTKWGADVLEAFGGSIKTLRGSLKVN
jgi:hypothetical protein